MAHFAILCPAEGGHMLSMGPVGQELVRRGHRVTLMAPEDAAPLAKVLDLPLHVVDPGAIQYPTSLVLDRSPWLGAGAADVSLGQHFRWYAEVLLKVLPPALRELEVDGLVVDHTVSAGGTAADHVGIPFVTVHSAMFWNEEPGVPPACTGWAYRSGRLAEWRNRLGYLGWRRFIQPTVNEINRHRRQWGLARLRGIDDTFSSLAQISQLFPEFDYPRKRLPDTFHYIGSLTADRRLNADHAFPWDRLDGRPLIFASAGTLTMHEDNGSVLPRIMSACADLDAQVVLALGICSDEEQGTSLREHLGVIPDNAVVVDFAPQLALLDRASLLITHAGVNTVLEAISRAVPMVALPRGYDQPAMGSRIAHSGVGLLGSFRSSTAAQIREMVKRVLGEDSFRRRARELQTAIRAAGGVSRTADIAEEAIVTRRPVRNGVRLTKEIALG